MIIEGQYMSVDDVRDIICTVDEMIKADENIEEYKKSVIKTLLGGTIEYMLSHEFSVSPLEKKDI